MEQAKINIIQFFIIINLFELGTSLVLSLGIGAMENAWIAILLGAIGGCVLYLIYYQLYTYYPDKLPTGYFREITGRYIGSILGFIYIIYFTYLSARVLRDFGELLITFAYRETPLFALNALMIITVIYAVKKGIEVIVRAGELNFLVMYLMALSGIVLVIITGLIDLNKLSPKLGADIFGILKEVATQTLYVPFGEAIVFSYLLPYLNNNTHARRVGIIALLLSGTNLAITTAINIGVLSAQKITHSPFPLLATIQQIQLGQVLERLDVFFLIALFIGAFFKITIFLYVACVGAADLFKIPSYTRVTFPIGLSVLFLSITIAENYSEHILEGLVIVPIFMHLPMQVIIPILLLGIAIIKNRQKKKKAQKGNQENEVDTNSSS